MEIDTTKPTDGRTRRAMRNREAIVGALFELVGEGWLQPTAQQVAERAAVGIRTVFRHFDDMESLYALMNERIEAEVVALLFGGESGGTIAERCRGLVGQRVAFFEKIGPYKRCGNLHRWRSRYLQEQHVRLVRALRADLLRWLPMLKEAPDDVVGAFDLATSFEAWDRLRGDQRCGRERARAVVERTLTALAGTYLDGAGRSR
jgi:AcrR family transcriptional regulator